MKFAECVPVDKRARLVTQRGCRFSSYLRYCHCTLCFRINPSVDRDNGWSVHRVHFAVSVPCVKAPIWWENKYSALGMSASSPCATIYPGILLRPYALSLNMVYDCWKPPCACRTTLNLLFWIQDGSYLSLHYWSLADVLIQSDLQWGKVHKLGLKATVTLEAGDKHTLTRANTHVL